MEEKKLGKIISINFGGNHYFGLHITFGGDGWAVSDARGPWNPINTQVTEYTRWTEEDRSRIFDETSRFLAQILSDAKKEYVDQLKGIPVEVTFEGNLLKEWRILTEVL